VSTEDDRPRRPGDYSNTGFNRGADPYPGSGYGAGPEQRGDPGFIGLDDPEYSNQETTVLPGSSPYDAFTEEPPAQRPRAGWHAGADLGLLVLRVVLGALFIAHALQQLFGWFQGDGIDGLARQLGEFGYSNTTALAWVTGVSELVGGTFVLLGLFTPAGAAALLGVMANVIVVKINGNLFVGGVELESIYAASAFAILFAGPGRISLDRPTPWYRNATAFGFTFLLIAAAAAVTILLVFR
jgi:putative oxidoreductase